MKVFLLGSGGREHALFWKLQQSPSATSVSVFPGNGGFPQDHLVQLTRPDGSPADLSNLDIIVEHVIQEKYDLVVVGPEQPLVDGIADRLHGVAPVFGPVRLAARLEGSKEFAKEFMVRHRIPTAQAKSFTNLEEARQYLETRNYPIVIKADGLAAGKGVTVAPDKKIAMAALEESLMNKKFGESGQKVLIEDFLKGEEASVFALCDGTRAIPFIAAQDYKRAFDDDQGPNTGGMGAYAPVPMVTPEMMETIQTKVLDPVIRGMSEEGTPYRGLLYAGLMVDGEDVNVVEFNCRFGDPETQPLMRLLDEDLADLLHRAASGNLEDRALRFKDETSMIVVLAAEGYPDSYRKDVPLDGFSDAESNPSCVVFHAGTKKGESGILSSGGRVLGVTAAAPSMKEARQIAYEGISRLSCEGLFYRKDIGKRVE